MYLAIYICVGEETHVQRRTAHTWSKGKHSGADPFLPLRGS